MKIKKIPYYLLVGLLTCGAGLILGLLSFSGMYALMPVLGFAIATFGLSVAYEGEIYFQNIKGAIAKLFKKNYEENLLAKDYLLKQFPNTNTEDCPQFFKDYELQLKALGEFGHKTLDAKSKKTKKMLEKNLVDLEKWFAVQLFQTPSESAYGRELKEWLTHNQQAEWDVKLDERKFKFIWVKGFSFVAGAFACVGASYLISGAFVAIPFLAAIPFAFWPILILPMALIAGTAYGLLTYNAITDFINNDTINKWYQKLRKDWGDNGFTLRNVLMAVMTFVLAALAIALTVCTAGTWWTVVSSTNPVFAWMKKIPIFVMGIIYPIVEAISALFFIGQNTAESLEMVDDFLAWTEKVYQKGFIKKVFGPLEKWWNKLVVTENWYQIFNPFRILLKLTVTPLRILLFLGHLVSIALTADRMPGIPQMMSFLVAIISEGFEDAHYFLGHSHTHHDGSTKSLLAERLDTCEGHNHNMDLPTFLLKVVVSPIYGLAALWDFAFGAYELSWQDLWKACKKQWGSPIEKRVDVVIGCSSTASKVEIACSEIDSEIAKLRNVSNDSKLAEKKIQQFKQVRASVTECTTDAELQNVLVKAANKPVFNVHRGFFAAANSTTRSQEFIEKLPERVNLLRN